MFHLANFIDKKLVQTPYPINKGFIIYEAIMGSRSYNCNNPNSDYDILGICMPPLEYILPSTKGVFPNFGTNPYQFNNWEQKKIFFNDKEYGFVIYNIVRFFDLALGSNPNFIELLFCPNVNITHINSIGHKIRDSRHLFLSKMCVHKMRAYAVSQLRKLETKKPIGGRKESYDKFGYDLKFAMNLMRLLLQTEQILLEKDLDIGRNGKLLFSIRNGEWELEKLLDIATQKEKDIEKLILSSDLAAKTDENRVKDLLIECIELQYGKVADKLVIEDDNKKILQEIKRLVEHV